MPPSTFFLSGLVKVSEKRTHLCQGPGGEGEMTSVGFCFFFFSQLLYSHLRSFNDKEQTLVVAGYFCQPHIPVARTLLIPQTGKPGHFQCGVFPLEVWDPFKKILYFVTFVTSGYPNKARERSVHFFTSRQAIEPDLL